MAIQIKIEEIRKDEKVCIVTVHDGEILVLDHVNIGLTLKKSGKANTAYIEERVKDLVKVDRRGRRQNERLTEDMEIDTKDETEDHPLYLDRKKQGDPVLNHRLDVAPERRIPKTKKIKGKKRRRWPWQT